MTPDLIFQLSSGIAFIGWLILACLSPFWASWDKVVVGIIIALLSLIYSYLNFANFSVGNLENFSSLKGVEIVFKNRELVMAAWAHIMAMDLMVAVWMKKKRIET